MLTRTLPSSAGQFYLAHSIRETGTRSRIREAALGLTAAIGILTVALLIALPDDVLREIFQ